MRALLEHFYILVEYLSEADIETIISLILIDLGFPSGRPAFVYLKSAILLYREKPEQLFTWELYPDVSKKNGQKSRLQIEIAIRREIRKCWAKQKPEKWMLYFPNGVSNPETGPTNSEVIIGLTQILRIWEACVENYKKKLKEGDKHEQNII